LTVRISPESFAAAAGIVTITVSGLRIFSTSLYPREGSPPSSAHTLFG
jgi:hypothetical protein